MIPAQAELIEDAEYENKIHQIYLTHYKNPVPYTDWNKKIQSLPKNHKLKFKDNLWDLSGSFFKDSLYWSKLWAANPQVENPHLIYQGNFLKWDQQTLTQVNSSKHSVDIKEQFPDLVIPSKYFSKGALKFSEFPASLSHTITQSKKQDAEIDLNQLKAIKVSQNTTVPFYLSEANPLVDGEIISSQSYGETATLEGEQIVVQIDSEVSIGSIFTVFKDQGRLGNVFQFLTGLSEKEIIVKGRIQISSYLEGTEALYTAVIIESINTMEIGDSLSKKEAFSYDFSQKGSIGTGSGLIIGTPYKNQRLLNLASLVYLDKGLSEGLRVGDVFYIQGQEEQNNSFKRPYNYTSSTIGKLKIIHATTYRATGIIIELKDPIYIGDAFSSHLKHIDLKNSKEHELIDEKTESINKKQEFLIDFEEDDDNLEEIDKVLDKQIKDNLKDKAPIIPIEEKKEEFPLDINLEDQEEEDTLDEQIEDNLEDTDPIIPIEEKKEEFPLDINLEDQEEEDTLDEQIEDNLEDTDPIIPIEEKKEEFPLDINLEDQEEEDALNEELEELKKINKGSDEDEDEDEDDEDEDDEDEDDEDDEDEDEKKTKDSTGDELETFENLDSL